MFVKQIFYYNFNLYYMEIVFIFIKEFSSYTLNSLGLKINNQIIYFLV